MGYIEILTLLPVVLVVGYGAVRALRRPSAWRAWRSELGPRTEEGGRLADAYVRRSRASRLAGAVVGFAAPLIAAAVMRRQPPGPLGNG
jgi:hypothetical protein